MIRDFLIFMVGTWTGVIAGFFLAGACMVSKRADEIERTELDSDDPRITRIYQRNKTTEI